MGVKDKFKVYEVRILASAGAGNFSKALDTALLVRRELGLSSLQNKPVPTVTILKNFIKTTRVVNNRTPEEIASLPELTDERIIMGQRMHETLLESTFLCQPTMYPLIGFQLVRTSIKYDQCKLIRRICRLRDFVMPCIWQDQTGRRDGQGS